jgi:hypothetical protein
MFTTEVFVITAFVLFSLADLRYRVVPGIEIFFLSAVLLGALGNPWGVAAVVFSVAWAWIRSWPVALVWASLFNPAAWPVLLTAFGVRRGVIGEADLWAIGGLACLFPWSAVILSIVGVELWRRWWQHRHPGPVPALPGMLLGLLTYFAGQAAFNWSV